MIEIMPAIMPRDFEELAEKVSQVEGIVPLVQIDIMDGKFVPGKTWPFTVRDDPHFLEICREEEGMPMWDTVDYELDLMVQYPEENLEQWITLGPKRLIVHFESLKNPEDAFEKLNEYQGLIEIGVAINIETDNEVLEPYIGGFDFIQLMGIASIGAQGEPFDERVLEKITYFRKKYPMIPLSVDGGVTIETAEQLISAGVKRLAIGSAIFGDMNVNENIENLLNLVQ